MTEELSDKIEKYLNGELTESERMSFEGTINNDAELKYKVEFMRAIPLVAKKHAKEELKKKLASFSFEGWDMGEAAAATSRIELPEPGSGLQSDKWRYLAVAASVILVVGLFFYIQETWVKTPTDIAKANNEETRVAIMTLPVSSIGDKSFGFVSDTTQTSMIVIISKPIIIDSTNRGLFAKLNLDTLFLRSYDSLDQLKIFEFDIAEENGEKIDDNGQPIAFQKPELRGMYLQSATNFYEIKNTNIYTLLSPVQEQELELLKFYTQK